jgi:two-component system, OmpR family, response regulator
MPHMLVLSRRLHEKVLFPGFKTAVEVLAVKPGVVRLGIDAPPEVKILRQELHDRAPEGGAVEMQVQGITFESKLRELNHLLRNRLNCASLGFAVMKQQLRAGLTQDAEATLAKIDEEFNMLQQRLKDNGHLHQPSTSPKPRRPKALLVEDNPNECELLATFLRMADLDVDTANDGDDALDYLKSRGQPDVVLLDMGLPRCNGATMIRKIRIDPAYAGLKIFAVTGHSPEEFDVAIGPQGVDRWFHKPLNPAALLRDLASELTPACH